MFGAARVEKDLAALPPEAFSGETGCLVVSTGSGSAGPTLDLLKQRGAVSGSIVLYAPGELEAEDERRLRLAVFTGAARLARTPEQLIDHVAGAATRPAAEFAYRLHNCGLERRAKAAAGRSACVVPGLLTC